jgi:hypothetical protein
MDPAVEQKLEEIKAKLTPELIARGVTKIVVRWSVRATVSVTVYMYMPTPDSKKRKLQAAVATWAITGAVSDAAANWAADFIGGIVKSIDEMIKSRRSDQVDPDDAYVQTYPE